MALLFMEGFDIYKDTDDVSEQKNYAALSSFTSFFTINTAGRISGKMLTTNSTTYGCWMRFPESTATQWVGVAIKVTTPNTTAGVVFAMYDSAGAALWSIYLKTDQKLEFRRGLTTVLGTSTNPITIDAWVYIEATCYVHDTAGTALVKIDGITEINLTSQDTKPGTTTNADRTLLGRTHSSSQYMDDLIIGDDSGTDLTAHPGDCHVELLTPDGDGATNNWTAVGTGTTNADRVDEAPSTDDDTTYVHSATATDKELYTLSNMTETGTAYYAVKVSARYRKESVGYRQVNLTMRSNVTEVDGPTENAALEYQWSTQIEENDPDGGGAWDQTAINALQVGIELKT